MHENAPAQERGQVLPLLTVVIVLAGLVCLAAGRMGGAAVARARATTAADAAALAGAVGGRPAADAAAAANDATVVRFERLGPDARVDVVLGGATAHARARGGGGGGAGPAPALRAALARAAQLLGRPVPVVPSPAGTGLPGDAATRHQRGLAVDVPADFVATLLPAAARAGLCQPYPEVHPVHFEVCGYRLP
ncbi:MAG TPA: pilus assembly protein TadG-related protein [Acidimicrobiales bacterium]|nr:pilus assembly protein TadG-related protein [Acidimicrobiales bacterium]